MNIPFSKYQGTNQRYLWFM